MRKLLPAILLVLSLNIFSQDAINNNSAPEDTSSMKKTLDDTRHFIDSMKTANAYKDATQGINNLITYQNEQRAKQKKQAILYIALGVFFLIVLIVGLRRRIKK